MGLTLFLTLIFLHIALGLALAFLVMFFALQTEHKYLRNFGLIVGSLLTVLALLSLIMGTVFAAKKPFMGCPYRTQEKMKQERMMQDGRPMMNEQREEIEENDAEEKQEQSEKNLNEQKGVNKNEKNIAFKQQFKKSVKSCPVKTKKQIEDDLKSGKMTGAACRTNLKEKKQKQGQK